MNKETANKELEKILESARRLGVEIDEEEALQWLAAVSAHDAGHHADEITYDTKTGVFGHRVVMLDFSPEELARFREIGKLVGFEDRPGVETALALSGSSAQSKIQTYPGDADFFERVNIHAETREEACRILAEIIREKALTMESGSGFQLIEVKFGSYPHELVREGETVRKGSSISWNPRDVRQGFVEAATPQGEPVQLRWEDAALDPGWCKLDWVVVDSIRGELANASNMLDATWETPDGEIIPLDGYLDPYFQEVYLEAESIPIFSKLAQHVSADALDSYVAQLEKEVKKYVCGAPPNYGKAAKRMYNIFRLTGRYEEAAFLRELFDEPASMLYQVWSLIRTIDDCCDPHSSITKDDMLTQTDNLILSVVKALEGDEETEVVRRLLRLRDALTRQEENHELTTEADTARSQVINIVNNFFHDTLTAMPQIKDYMDCL